VRRLSKTSVVAVAAALVLTSCGSDNKTAASGGGEDADVCKGSDGSGPKIGLAYDVGGRGDQSFNDAAYAGVKKAVEDLDATCIEVKASADDNDTTRAQRLRTLAEQGYDPIIGVGFIYSPAASEVAKDYPDTHFAVIVGYSQFVKPYDNLGALTFAEEQGSFLVGAAAALKSKSGKIGFIGGVETDLIKKFEAGYTAGAKKVNPNIDVEVQYITQPPDFTGFNDPAKGKEIATSMYGDGADVIYAAAGGSGPGVAQAASEAGDPGSVWYIGVDSDQYNLLDAKLKPYVLTSMLKKVDVAVHNSISNLANGDWRGGHEIFDLKRGGVDYATSGGFVDDIKSKLDDYKQQIIDGKIQVPTKP